MIEIKDLGFGVIQVNETKPTISKMESVDNYLCKWQKLKEWIKEREKKHTLMLKASAFEDIEILKKMKELEGEDE